MSRSMKSEKEMHLSLMAKDRIEIGNDAAELARLKRTSGKHHVHILHRNR